MLALVTVGCAGVLALASFAGLPVLAFAVAVLQVVLISAWYDYAGLPGAAGGRMLATVAALAADVAMVRVGGAQVSIGPVLPVLGLILPAAILHQLGRQDGRPRVTDSLTGTVAVATGAVLAASFLGVRAGREGGAVIACGLAGAAVGATMSLVSGPYPRGSEVGVDTAVRIAAVLGVTLAAGAGALVGAASTVAVDAASGAWLGGVAGLVTVVAVLGTAYGSAGNAPERTRVAVGATLPLALAGPATYVLGRILVG